MRRISLGLATLATSLCAACTATGAGSGEARYTAAGFLVEDDETYDAYGYPIDETHCGSWDGVVECRPTTRRDQLEVFPEHPERFLETREVDVGPLSLTLPEGARLVNACIGALTQEMWDSVQTDTELGECLWVRADRFEPVMTSLADQLRAEGFTDENTGPSNPQAINQSMSFVRGCEATAVIVVFADQLFNRPREPHVHVLVAYSQAGLCWSGSE